MVMFMISDAHDSDEFAISWSSLFVQLSQLVSPLIFVGFPIVWSLHLLATSSNVFAVWGLSVLILVVFGFAVLSNLRIVRSRFNLLVAFALAVIFYVALDAVLILGISGLIMYSLILFGRLYIRRYSKRAKKHQKEEQDASTSGEEVSASPSLEDEEKIGVPREVEIIRHRVYHYVSRKIIFLWGVIVFLSVLLGFASDFMFFGVNFDLWFMLFPLFIVFLFVLFIRPSYDVHVAYVCFAYALLALSLTAVSPVFGFIGVVLILYCAPIIFEGIKGAFLRIESIDLSSLEFIVIVATIACFLVSLLRVPIYSQLSWVPGGVGLFLLAFLASIAVMLLGLIADERVRSITRYFGLLTDYNAIHDFDSPKLRSRRIVMFSATIIGGFVFLYVSGVFLSTLGHTEYLLFVVSLLFVYFFVSYLYIFSFSVSRVYIFRRGEPPPHVLFDDVFGGENLRPKDWYGFGLWGLPWKPIAFMAGALIIMVFVEFVYNIFGVAVAILLTLGVVFVIAVYVPWELYNTVEIEELEFEGTFFSVFVGVVFGVLVSFWGLKSGFISYDVFHVGAVFLIGGIGSVFVFVDSPGKARVNALVKRLIRDYTIYVRRISQSFQKGFIDDGSAANRVALLTSKYEALLRRYENASITPLERILASILLGSVLALVSMLNLA